MADRKISQLDPAATLTGDETMELVQAGENVRATVNIITSLINGSQNLTFASTTVWNLNNGKIASLTLTGDTILDIQNLPDGHSFGMLKVTNSSGHVITFPEGSKIPAGFELTATGVDWIGYHYDGTNFWWSIENDFEDAPEGGGDDLFYLTWNILHPVHEVYNSLKGLRKISSGDGWTQSWSEEQLTAEHELICKVDAVANKYRLISLNSARTGSPSTGGHPFAMITNTGGTLSSWEGAVDGTQNVSFSAGDFLRIKYSGGVITYAKSADLSTWTPVATSAGSPSGAYYVSIEIYSSSPNNGFDEIYIQPV